MRGRRPAHGQSTLEWTVLTLLMAAALVGMSIYWKRAVQGSLRRAGDGLIGAPYLPGRTTGTTALQLGAGTFDADGKPVAVNAPAHQHQETFLEGKAPFTTTVVVSHQGLTTAPDGTLVPDDQSSPTATQQTGQETLADEPHTGLFNR